jgi:soluble P-type ATPase
MLTIDIPGAAALRLEHLVLDFNGTLACDGALLEGVAPCLDRVAEHLQVHVRHRRHLRPRPRGLARPALPPS